MWLALVQKIAKPGAAAAQGPRRPGAIMSVIPVRPGLGATGQPLSLLGLLFGDPTPRFPAGAGALPAYVRASG